MHTLSKLCMAGLIGLAASSAHAGLVTYRFTATIAWMNEQAPGSDTFPAVDQSNLPGTLIKVGDTISGILRYDTSAALTPFQPQPYPDHRSALYRPGVMEYLSYTIDRTGYTFTSDPNMNKYGYYQVWDSLAKPAGVTGDSFRMSVNNLDGGFARTADFIVRDGDGVALHDTAMPAELDPTRFTDGRLAGGFSRLADNAWMGFDADMTSLAEVPEPGVPVLLGAGAAGMLVLRRRAGRRTLR